MASEKMLSDLFHDTLKDIYFAEKKILTALPKMAKAAQIGRTQGGLREAQSETEEQISRLEKGIRPRSTRRRRARRATRSTASSRRARRS